LGVMTAVHSRDVGIPTRSLLKPLLFLFTTEFSPSARSYLHMVGNGSILNSHLLLIIDTQGKP